MSVLETFIHDPLCEWSKKKSASAGGYALAVRKLDRIDKKLMGEMDGKVLSVEAHVHELISQGMDGKRLGKMYIGWAAYL